ncbi:MAG: DUF2127 domain-containing protein [Hyphomicrobiaceae bacterium]|nr:DUF2127 domain-containing protein [Hyphomicrobiaceae bacterium]
MSAASTHRYFVIGVVLKGANALAELAGGALLLFSSTASIRYWVSLLTVHELAEDPRDFVATQIKAAVEALSVDAKNFYALYLLAHGIIKALLVFGLLRERAWAFPLSLWVLGGFVTYQVLRFSLTHSLALAGLTIFDLIVMVLIWREWRNQSSTATTTG